MPQGSCGNRILWIARRASCNGRRAAGKNERRRSAGRTRVSAIAKRQNPAMAKLQPWIQARRKHGLSHAHIQMARELGMNPKKFGKLDNHRQEPWKAPLPIFIESLYFKRFGRERPDVVRSIEETAATQRAKRHARQEAKQVSFADAGERLALYMAETRAKGLMSEADQPYMGEIAEVYV